MSIYLARNGRMLTRLNGTRYFGDNSSPVPPGPSFDTVTIGSQTWMSKNLTIDDGLGGIHNMSISYGSDWVREYYYTWEAAVRVAATVEGWHLPTPSEWEELANYVGGASTAAKKLKSTYGWVLGGAGTDDYGFSVFPAGYWEDRSPKRSGEVGYFWTNTEYSTTKANLCYFPTGNQMNLSVQVKTDGYTVRLIKD